MFKLNPLAGTILSFDGTRAKTEELGRRTQFLTSCPYTAIRKRGIDTLKIRLKMVTVWVESYMLGNISILACRIYGK